MELIDHKDLKEEILESEEVKEEYDKLNVIYEIKKQIIRYRIENNLTQKERFHTGPDIDLAASGYHQKNSIRPLELSLER